MQPQALFEKKLKKATLTSRIVQAVLIGASILVVLLFFWGENREFLVAGLCTSAATALALPGKSYSRPRVILLGHLVAIVEGSALSLIPFPERVFAVKFVVFTAAFGCVLLAFITAALKCLHPPSVATLIGILILREGLLQVGFCVMLALVVLVAIQTLVKQHLRDLC